VALKALGTEARVNGVLGRHEVKLTKNGNTYTASEPVNVWGAIGIELQAIDQLNGASNRNGVPHITLYLDSTEVFAKHLNRFAFAESRQILVHMDYPTKAATGRKFQKLYIEDGNELSFFNKGDNNGRITLTEEGKHDLRIVLEDAYGNTSRVNMTLEVTEPSPSIKMAASPHRGPSGHEQIENILLSYAVANGETASKARYYSNQMTYEVDPAYQVNDHIVYLWDLRHGLPDSVNLCSIRQEFDYDTVVPSGKEFHFYDNHADLHFAPNTLFDTLYLRMDYQENYANGKELWAVNESDPIPFQSYVTAVLRPGREYDKKTTHVYGVDDAGNFWYEGGKWEDDAIRFRFRNTGKFTLVSDDTPPEIKPLKASSGALSFSIKDRLSGIGDFRATLNGEFLLMNYDPKNRYIWAVPRNSGEPMKGDLKLTVTDQAGNESVYNTKL
ncbi:MAG: M23 family peptidase, partial [Cyclobacteriaceae bacterium]